MASPVVCILKGKDGKNGVRIAIDYRYVNKFTRADALPRPNPSDILQKIGNASFISTFDSTSGYHQTEVHHDSRWLTGFIYDDKLYTWVRTPFGLRNSGATFVRHVPHVCCGQTSGWMPLGIEVGFAPCHIVLHGIPVPLRGAHKLTVKKGSLREMIHIKAF